jgi:hypothetical protein
VSADPAGPARAPACREHQLGFKHARDHGLIVLRLHAYWREQRVAEQVRSHFDVAPVVVFYFDSEGHIVERDEA